MDTPGPPAAATEAGADAAPSRAPSADEADAARRPAAPAVVAVVVTRNPGPWFDDTMAAMGGAHGHGSQKREDGEHGDKDGKDGEPPAHATDESAKGKAEMPSADRIYTAQVLWDESMADGAARWAKSQPQGLLVLLAGNGHCHDSAIVNRIKRRGVDKVISLRPVLDVEGRVAEALAKPMNDYVVVLQLPADVKAQMARQ